MVDRIQLLVRQAANYGLIASVDVERHARDFMEAAKKLQLYFVGLERDDQPTKAETLQKVMQITMGLYK